MADTKFYFDFNFPLNLIGWLLGLIFGTSGTTPEVVDPATREWFSQPRPGDDPGIETITTTFKLPLSVSELTMEILRVPCVVEPWYQDRSNNWRPVLDEARIPLRVNISRSDTKSYYKYANKVYPIVAKQMQFRITRVNDLTMEGAPYVVGLRNTLIRRNVYDRSQGQQYFEDEQDIFGNVISKYIKDWDASKAADDDPYTFWKSQPMPDPSAVASLYLDLRGNDGEPKTIDKVYIDPVYSGTHLNLYYSSDDTVGTRKLNPISIRPDEDENTDWRLGRGRSDTSTGVQESFYRWTMSVGPQIVQDAWIGVEWTPDFDPTDGPAQNPVLFRTIGSDGVWNPSVTYDVGAAEFKLEFDDGSDTRTYTAPVSPLYGPGDTLRVVAGWNYDPDMVYLSVVNQRGVEIAHLHGAAPTLPQSVLFDGQSEMFCFRGLVTALVVKLESYAVSSAAFQNSATYYTDPDPVIPDSTGVIPSTTLDNAIYAVSWTTQEHGSGGAHETAFDAKEWTPIWRNYIAEKGLLFFPKATALKYLKLEFTNLSEQPYPIYESGLEVKYKVFPLSVVQSSTTGVRYYSGDQGFLGMGALTNSPFGQYVTGVNWLVPFSVLGVMGSVLTNNIPPVVVNAGAGYISDTLPNQGAALVPEPTVAPITPRPGLMANRMELGSSYVYRRETLQPYILAEDAYVTTIKAEGLQALSDFTDIPWEDIEASNPGAITHVRSTGAMPVRGTDWWIYPGQQLKIPASVMEKITATDTITERKFTSETRIRFNTTSIHRYEYKTLKRDAAIAYFAGVREVIPFTSTYIPGEDKPIFDFPAYDGEQFALSGVRSLVTGPITTDRKIYNIENRMFERSIDNWIADGPAWSWDPTKGRWLRGTAKLVANGALHTLLSTRQSVTEGDEIDLSVAIMWADIDSGLLPSETLFPSETLLPMGSSTPPDDDAVCVRWGVRYYDAADAVIEDDVMDEFDYADVTADEDEWQDLTGTTTVPAGAVWFRFLMQVTESVPMGNVWFESANALDADDAMGTAFKALQTSSSFSKVAVDFSDSGLWRGDSMWADAQEDTESIDDTKLAYYTRTIPETIPGGKWGDTVKGWGSDDAEWGSPFQIVSVGIDGTLRRDNHRVLHFRRVAGAGEAGIKVKQWTHFVPQALCRLGAVFYKPIDNDNEATIRLRRLADGVIVYEETLAAPAGRWVDFKTKFFEVPVGPNQEYEVYLTLTGDDEDELYLSDLYTELALVRYFVRLGTIGSFLHEVTDLRYANGRVNVTTTDPVNDVSVQVAILSPEAWAYGVRLTPYYLK